MSVITLPRLRQQVQHTQLRSLVRKLNFEKDGEARTCACLSKALQLLEQPHMLPMNIPFNPFKENWVDIGQSLLTQSFSTPSSQEYLSKLGWARILRMGSEGIRQIVSPSTERTTFLLDKRLEESLLHYQGRLFASILRVVTLSDFFPPLATALEQRRFYPFAPMPLSEDLIKEDRGQGPVFSWRAKTQHSLIGYVAIHTHHAAYLRAFLNQGGSADDILVGDTSLPQYQLTFLQHICQDVLAMAVGRPLYTIQHRILPLSYLEKAQLALELGANPRYAYGDRPSPWEWIEGALRYPDLKDPKPVVDLMELFENHELRIKLKQHAFDHQSSSRESKRL